MIEGVGGLEAHVLLALDMGMPAREFGRIHHLPAAQLAAVIDGIRDRGLIGEDGRLSARDTPSSSASRRSPTNSGKPYEILQPGELDELMATLEPFATRLLAASRPVGAPTKLRCVEAIDGGVRVSTLARSGFEAASGVDAEGLAAERDVLVGGWMSRKHRSRGWPGCTAPAPA